MSLLRALPRALARPAARLYSTPAAAVDPAPLTPAPKPTVSHSSTNAGEVLYNINYFRNKPDIVALEDADYPAWLWTVLDTAGKKETEEDVGDLYSKSKKARRIAKKREEKRALLAAKNPEVAVPIEEQTLDLPFATGGGEFTKVVSAVGPLASKSDGKTTVLVGGAGVEVLEEEAREARAELKKALRKKGRKGIKEGNYLSQM